MAPTLALDVWYVSCSTPQIIMMTMYHKITFFKRCKDIISVNQIKKNR